MGNVLVNEAYLSQIASAVRNGFPDTYKMSEIPEAIVNENIYFPLLDASVSTFINTEWVTLSRFFFFGCQSLSSVSFPVCTSIESKVFNGCQSLSSVSFPVCTMIGDEAFSGCVSLSSVSFPVCTTIGISAFYGCTSLTSVDFPVCTSIGNNAFNGCTSLTSVDFPVCTTIGISAFYGCTSLIALYLGASSVCVLKSAYSRTFFSTPMVNGDGHIYVPASLVTAYKRTQYWSNYASHIYPIDATND